MSITNFTRETGFWVYENKTDEETMESLYQFLFNTKWGLVDNIYFDQLKTFESFEDFIKNFQLNNEILESAKKDFIVMHPMPINIGIEIDKEALKNNRFIYKEQLKLATKTRVVSYQFAYGEI